MVVAGQLLRRCGAPFLRFHGRRRSASVAVRVRIVLACAEPGVVYQRAAELGVATMTVGRGAGVAARRRRGAINNWLLQRRHPERLGASMV